VQVIGLAPVHSGAETPALLVKGLPLGDNQLATIEATLGVAGAIFIGDKLVARSSQRLELQEALRAAAHLSDGTASIATAAGVFLVRVGRTGPGAMAARVVWIVAARHHLAQVRPLVLLVWSPLVGGALLLLLLIANVRRTNGGNP
jgi:hypothetical protein